LVNIYIPLVDELLVFDNSESKLDLIAEKPYQNQLLISNFHKWNKLMKSI
jgi:predicted ABC-type ATPase